MSELVVTRAQCRQYLEIDGEASKGDSPPLEVWLCLHAAVGYFKRCPQLARRGGSACDTSGDGSHILILDTGLDFGSGRQMSQNSYSLIATRRADHMRTI